MGSAAFLTLTPTTEGPVRASTCRWFSTETSWFFSGSPNSSLILGLKTRGGPGKPRWNPVGIPGCTTRESHVARNSNGCDPSPAEGSSSSRSFRSGPYGGGPGSHRRGLSAATEPPLALTFPSVPTPTARSSRCWRSPVRGSSWGREPSRAAPMRQVQPQFQPTRRWGPPSGVWSSTLRLRTTTSLPPPLSDTLSTTCTPRSGWNPTRRWSGHRT